MMDAFTHDQNVYLLLERHGVELVGPMAVTFAQPLQGTKSAYESHVRMLPAGTRVDSYLLHFNSSSRIGIAEGEIEFERPIVGVIARGTQLNYSDKILGLEGLAYERRDASLRGLKSGTKEVPSPDVILFGTSYNTVGIHCEAGKHTVAEVRILVQSK